VANAGCAGVNITGKIQCFVYIRKEKKRQIEVIFDAHKDIEIIGPPGSVISSLSLQTGRTDQWVRTLTWNNPINGLCIVCGKAYDNVNGISPQTCYTLNVQIMQSKSIRQFKTVDIYLLQIKHRLALLHQSSTIHQSRQAY
jgi:hypothetical protein